MCYKKFKNNSGRHDITLVQYRKMFADIIKLMRTGLLNGRIWQLPKAMGTMYIRQKLYGKNQCGIVMAWGDNVRNKRGYGEYHYFDGSLDPIARISWSWSGVKHENHTLYTFRACESFKRELHQRLRVHKQTYIRLY
jgi:hypothetical protein